MTTLQIALIVILVVMLLAWLFLRQRSRGATAAKPAERIDTLTGWPPQATRLLSGAERTTLAALMRALPECIVLAQVPLSRFIDVPKRNSYADWLRRVGYQSVDFVVCDMSAKVISVIELQPLQMSERAKKRQVRIARLLKAAQISLYVWREDNLPTADAIRELLVPDAPALNRSRGPRRPPVSPDPLAFDETRLELPDDQPVDPLEPPPSTWYDDLDSDPVPLGKR